MNDIGINPFLQYETIDEILQISQESKSSPISLKKF